MERSLMDWANERYVRVYTRDTADWLALSWQARALLMFILRKADRVGAIELGRHGIRGLAGVVGMPPDVVDPAMQELLTDGAVQLVGSSLLVPNFIDAQEATASPTQRSREHRERKRDMIRSGLRVDHRKPVVYFIQSEDGGHIKIGFTEDLARRIENLNSARPDRLVVLGAFGAQPADERRMHEALSAHREKGEWFIASPAVVAAARAAALPAADCGTVLEALRASLGVACNETSHATPNRTVPCLAEQTPLPPAVVQPTSAMAKASPDGSLSGKQEGPAKPQDPASPQPDPPSRPVEPPGPPVAGVTATALLDALEQTGRVSMDKPKAGKWGAGAMGEGRCRDLIGLQRAMHEEGVDQADVKLLVSWLRAGGWNFYGGGTPAAPGVIPVQKFVDKLKTLLDDARAWEKTANPMRSVKDPKTIGYHDCQSAADWRKEMEEQDRLRAETVAAWKNPTPEMLAQVAEEKRMLEELQATVAAQRAARGEA